MTTPALTHYVFVDLENVPVIDLGLVEGKPVHVTLMIGKHQKKMDLPLVQQIHRLAAQVELVEVGVSGRNALDLTLSYYLGQAALRAPDARFSIVSNDKDFEPMIAHLTGKGTKVVRCESFAAMFPPQKPSKRSPPKAAPPVKPGAMVENIPLVNADTLADRFEKLAIRLQTRSSSRPKTKPRLLARINTDLGNKLTAVEQNERLDELIRRGILSLDESGAVDYNPEADVPF